MPSSRTQGLVSILLIMIILMMSVSPMFVSAQNPPGGQKNGPYVDKVVFKVGGDQAIISLLDDEIDLCGVHPSYLEQLSEAEDIGITHTLRNGYGFCSINCATIH